MVLYRKKKTERHCLCEQSIFVFTGLFTDLSHSSHFYDNLLVGVNDNRIYILG